MSNYRSQKGLSLIELLIAMSIITIMSTTVVLASGIIPSLRVSGASKELIGNIRKAQSQAIKEQNIYKISFDLTNQNYSTYRIQGEVETLVETFQLNRVNITALSPNITNNEIRFNASGDPLNNVNSPLGVATITLSNNQGKSITVEISPAGSIKSY